MHDATDLQIKNTGEWRPIMEWLNSLTGDQGFRIPFGSRPPIRVVGEAMTLAVDTSEGTKFCAVGEVIQYLPGAGFQVAR